jgi:hypothetical protein
LTFCYRFAVFAASAKGLMFEIAHKATSELFSNCAFVYQTEKQKQKSGYTFAGCVFQ